MLFKIFQTIILNNETINDRQNRTIYTITKGWFHYRFIFLTVCFIKRIYRKYI